MAWQPLGDLVIPSADYGSGYVLDVDVYYNDAQNIDANQTDVYLDVTAVTTGGGLYSLDARAWGATLRLGSSGGSVIATTSGTAAPDFSSGSFTITSGVTGTVTHNDDGTASIVIEAEWLGGAGNFPSGFPSAASPPLALPTIPRGSKRWNGSSWVSGVWKRWNGSSWVVVVPKRWSGSAWVPTF